MVGTGTAGDPYQITTIEEFIEYINIEQAHLKLMNDLDFNDYDGWMLNTIDVRADEIDGDGHGLYNIYIKDKYLFNNTESNGNLYKRTTTFHNLIFEIV